MKSASLFIFIYLSIHSFIHLLLYLPICLILYFLIYIFVLSFILPDRTPHPAADRQGEWPKRKHSLIHYKRNAGWGFKPFFFICLAWFMYVSFLVQFPVYFMVLFPSFSLCLLIFLWPFPSQSSHLRCCSLVMLFILSLFRLSPFPCCSVLFFFNFAVVFHSFLLSFLFHLKCILF